MRSPRWWCSGWQSHFGFERNPVEAHGWNADMRLEDAGGLWGFWFGDVVDTLSGPERTRECFFRDRNDDEAGSPVHTAGAFAGFGLVLGVGSVSCVV